MLCNPDKQQKSCTKVQARGEKNNMIGFSYRDVVFDGIDEVKQSVVVVILNAPAMHQKIFATENRNIYILMTFMVKI